MKQLKNVLVASLLSFITSLVMISLVLNPVFVSAQSYPPPAYSSTYSSNDQSANYYSEPELEQLVAPIALYPDELLSHVLAGAVYPQQVASAEQFLQNNSFASNNVLAQAVVAQPWDSSIQFLVQFPNVLAMMNDNLDWTQRLGDAFYYQPGDVMNAIQALRQRALDNQTLASNQQIVVSVQNDGIIVIKTRVANQVYVPYYNPTYVYGDWNQPEYPPVVFAPPPNYQQDYYSPVIAFAVGVVIASALLFPTYPDWHHHYLSRGDWYGHSNWQPNTRWRVNSASRAAAVTFNETHIQPRFQANQRAPLPSNLMNRNSRPSTGSRPPLLQPDRALAQPNLVPNRAPNSANNRGPNRGLNSAPLAPTNRAPLVQPGTGLPHVVAPNRPSPLAPLPRAIQRSPVPNQTQLAPVAPAPQVIQRAQAPVRAPIAPAPQVIQRAPEPVRQPAQVFHRGPESVRPSQQVFHRGPESVRPPQQVFQRGPEQARQPPQVFQRAPEPARAAAFQRAPESVRPPAAAPAPRPSFSPVQPARSAEPQRMNPSRRER